MISGERFTTKGCENSISDLLCQTDVQNKVGKSLYTVTNTLQSKRITYVTEMFEHKTQSDNDAICHVMS